MTEILGRDDQTAVMAQHLNQAQLQLALQHTMRGFITMRSYTTSANQQALVFDSDYLRTLRLFAKDTTDNIGALLIPIGRKLYYKKFYYPPATASRPKYFICDWTRWLFEPPAKVDLIIEATITIKPPIIDSTQSSMLENGDEALAWLASVFLLSSLGEYDAAAKKLGVALQLIELLSAGQQTQLQTVDGYNET